MDHNDRYSYKNMDRYKCYTKSNTKKKEASKRLFLPQSTDIVCSHLNPSFFQIPHFGLSLPFKSPIWKVLCVVRGGRLCVCVHSDADSNSPSPVSCLVVSCLVLSA